MRFSGVIGVLGSVLVKMKNEYPANARKNTVALTKWTVPSAIWPGVGSTGVVGNNATPIAARPISAASAASALAYR